MLLMTVLMLATPIAKADEQTSTTDTEITITPRKISLIGVLKQ